MLKVNKRLQHAQQQQANRREDLEQGRIRIERTEKREESSEQTQDQKGDR